MDYRQMTAPCGLDCFNCPVYLAGENEKLKKAVAERLNIPSERVACRGCRNERGRIEFLNMTEPCNVYKSIDKKDFASVLIVLISPAITCILTRTWLPGGRIIPRSSICP